MSETQNMQNGLFAEGFNPFGDDEPVVQKNVAEEAPVAAANEQIENQNLNVESEKNVNLDSNTQPSFDPNEFVKERFGFSSVEEAEQEIKRLKETREAQPSFEFKDETSRRLFEAIKEGKTDDVYEVLSQQRKLDKLVSSELTPDLASEIIKTSIQSKYKDLTSDEVDLLFYENYFYPAKPEKTYDETDEDFEGRMKNWQSQVDFVNKKMIIDAKVYRPEIEKMKQELVLPDVYNQGGDSEELSEEQEVMMKAREVYEQYLGSEFQKFNGFEVRVKDEEVEMPVSFLVGDEEKVAMKTMLDDFDADSYLENRWFQEDGKPNIQQIMSDIYLLENRDKIFQKVANEAASQRLLHHLKKTGNVTINQPTPQGTPKPNPNAEMERLADWAFSI